MKLNVSERLSLLQVLPAEGNFLTLKIMKDLTEIVGLNEEAFKEFGIKEVGGQVSWNNKGTEEREIKIGEKATDIIVESLKKLDQQNKLKQNYFTLYEKFVEKQGS